MIPALLAFSVAAGGLRDQRLFALAGAAAWLAVAARRPPPGAARPWLPWLGWAALSAVLSAQPLSGLPVLARWAAALACASLASSWSARERETWLKSLLGAAAVLAVAALFTGYGRGWGHEMTGLIPPNSNYTAFVLSAATAAAAAWAAHPRGRPAAAALCALALPCLALSRSRGALLGLAAAAVVWAARRWGAKAAAAGAAAAALAAGALFGGALPAPVEDALLKKYRTHAEARPRIWRAAAGVASESPWFGSGPGNFASGFRLRPVPFEDGAARWSMSTAYAHGEPWQAAAETGWAGLILWLAAAGLSLRALLRRAGTDPAAEAAAAAAAAMSAQLLVDNMLQLPALAALWLCALAVCAPPASGRAWPRWAAPAGAVLALAAWLPAALAAKDPGSAARLFPAEPGPREDLAYAAVAAENPALADSHWAAAERLEPFSAMHPWRRAQLAGAAGRWEDCERLAARAAGLEPGFVSARLLRAEALLRLSRRDEARAELRAAREAASRGGPAPLSGYEKTVRAVPPGELERLSAAASGRK